MEPRLRRRTGTHGPIVRRLKWTFSAISGLLLALAAAWSLSYFVFEGPFVLAPLPLTIGFVVTVAVTVGIGLWSSRGLYDRTPLDVLRAER